jgi:hypothetical protein
MDLRVSKVAPAVEDSLGQLVDMVKQLGRKPGDLTESQSRRMVNYLGNIDDMRTQIVVMVQRYENDGHVLKRLLNLIDRIDDVKQLAVTSNGGVEEVNNGMPSPSEKEIAKHYDTPFNPLMVSEVNLLDASGLFNDVDEAAAAAAAKDEEAEPDGADFWDHEDDPSQIAPEEELPKEVGSINLSASSVDLPTIPLPLSASQASTAPPSLSSSQLASIPPPDAPISDTSIPASVHTLPPQQPADPVTSINEQRSRAKGKGKKQEGDSDSESGSEDGAGRGRFGRMRQNLSRSRSLSRSSDESSGSSSDENQAQSSSRRRKQMIGVNRSRINRRHSLSGIPVPPPLPPRPTVLKKAPVNTGPCDPVLCRICYEEFTRLEHLYGFSECGHQYCRECLQDYLTTNIVEGAVLDLVCPFPYCETEVLPKDIKTLCVPEIYTKYERFTVIAALRMDPNARWCPNPECNNGIKADPTSNWVYCSACKFEFCFHCMAERHDGFECGKEALEFLEKKKTSEMLAQEKFIQFADEYKAKMKPCPACNVYIEKNDGCNHMTCGNNACKTQFCWLCLSLYAADHFSNPEQYPDCYDKQYWAPVDYNNTYVIADYAPPRRGRMSNFAKKLGIYMGVGVAVVTLGVPAAVIGGPVYGCFRLHKRLQARRRDREERQRRVSYYDPNFVPPSPDRIAEARREAARLRQLENEAFRR